jgi:hypothetical protein
MDNQRRTGTLVPLIVCGHEWGNLPGPGGGKKISKKIRGN